MESHSQHTPYQRAIAFHQAGDLDHAESLYQSILRDDHEHAGASHFLGLVFHARVDLERAFTYVVKSIDLKSDNAIFQNNYGVLLRDMGRPNDVEEAFLSAIQIDPQYADALSNLGLCHLDRDSIKTCEEHLRKALAMNPSHVDARLCLAKCHLAMRRFTTAAQEYQRIIDKSPSDHRAKIGLAKTQLGTGHPAEAVETLLLALEKQPDNADIHLQLSSAYRSEGRIDNAVSEIDLACSLSPDRKAWRLKTLGLCPAVFENEEMLHAYRESLKQRVDSALSECVTIDWKKSGKEGVAPPFELSHHGVCNRSIKEKFASLFAPSFPQRPPPLRETDRPRIGFLVTPSREAGFIRNMRHIIPGLDAERFEPVVLCPAAGLDMCRKAIHGDQIKWAPFPSDFGKAVDAIREAQVDILYHRQVGTDAFNFLLPLARCAPIQCTGWGTHGTSGHSVIDYYLSSNLIEIEKADEHYSETLYRFDTLPTCQSRIKKPASPSRNEFSLPTSGPIYFCPHRLAKFHPAFDALLKGVLESVPNATLVIMQGKHPYALEMLQRRMERTIGRTLMQRVRFIPPQTPNIYYRLFALADVVLDSPVYSTSLTGFDALSFGIPIVTLPGVLNVQRYALALYKRLKIDEFIADSPESYIAIAARLGLDEKYRRHWSRIILDRSEILFEDQAAIREHETFFDYAWTHRKTTWKARG